MATDYTHYLVLTIHSVTFKQPRNIEALENVRTMPPYNSGAIYDFKNCLREKPLGRHLGLKRTMTYYNIILCLLDVKEGFDPGPLATVATPQLQTIDMAATEQGRQLVWSPFIESLFIDEVKDVNFSWMLSEAVEMDPQLADKLETFEIEGSSGLMGSSGGTTIGGGT